MKTEITRFVWRAEYLIKGQGTVSVLFMEETSNLSRNHDVIIHSVKGNNAQTGLYTSMYLYNQQQNRTS